MFPLHGKVSLKASVVCPPRFPAGERPAPLYLQIQAHVAVTVSPREVPHQPRVLHRAAF